MNVGWTELQRMSQPWRAQWRHRLTEKPDRRLGRIAVGERGRGYQTGDGGEVHDRAGLMLSHQRQGMFAPEEHAVAIHRHAPPPRLQV
jgi:hypothetical protein